MANKSAQKAAQRRLVDEHRSVTRSARPATETDQRNQVSCKNITSGPTCGFTISHCPPADKEQIRWNLTIPVGRLSRQRDSRKKEHQCWHQSAFSKMENMKPCNLRLYYALVSLSNKWSRFMFSVLKLEECLRESLVKWYQLYLKKEVKMQLVRRL